jgi:hypothetical protein
MEVVMVEDPALSHVPDLPEGTLVYRSIKRRNKLAPRLEGPYRFRVWSGKGDYALVEDANKTQFTVARHHLHVPPEWADA